MKTYFHFTLGPVQGFVAQARRTRDFWAGSFILSFLSAVALKTVRQLGGDVIFPLADEDYLSWLEGKRIGNRRPTQGVIPNRFMAKVDDDNFEPHHVEQSVKAAWNSLADRVWMRDLNTILKGDQSAITKAIWNRQVTDFWEISWALTPHRGASNIIDRRKNWRTHMPTKEPGIKCMVMDGCQELSGTPKPDAKKLAAYWEPIRKVCGLDLRKGEHLCAIAFIKRRFHRHFKELDESMPGSWRLQGWETPSGVPSVVYMAAVHWLEKVIQTEEESTLDKLINCVCNLGAERGEWDTDIACLKKACEDKHYTASRFRSLDGQVFFESALDNELLYANREAARAMKNALQELKIDSPPTPFYSVLRMDGDNLGRNMGDPEKQDVLSRSLKKFTDAAPTIVGAHNGFLIYAGGDDVLALLPLEDALPCATALRNHYNQCFMGTPIHTSLSGAVVYAHMKMPLTRVLEESHQLLNDVAKEGRGRDAIAVRVLKPGGLHLEWGMPWIKALGQDGKLEIETLTEAFVDQEGVEAPYSSRFFFKIRERFDLLNPIKDEGKPVLDKEKATTLMASEYLNSGVNEERVEKLDIEEARTIIRPLLDQCRPVIRVDDEASGMRAPEDQWHTSNRLEVDGALLVRFLAQKGVER